MRAQTKLKVLLFILGIFFGSKVFSQNKIYLWSGKVPSTNKFTLPFSPSVRVYLPEKSRANGTSVIICPGGSYRILALKHEGIEIAKWFNSIGVTAFVLKYRLGVYNYHNTDMLQDIQQAICYVRKNAPKMELDPFRIGVVGFSAGGHLASAAGTHFDICLSNIQDENGHPVSCRPDFMVLVYPVISMQDSITHKASRFHLLGWKPTKDAEDFMSSEMHVTENTPPTFIVHAIDDPVVNVKNSIYFNEALCKHHIQSKLQLYQTGGHGFGIQKSKGGEASTWNTVCAKWMYEIGLVEFHPGSNIPQANTGVQLDNSKR